MTADNHNLFSRLEINKPDTTLGRRILQEISRRERLVAWHGLVGWGLTSLAALISLFPASSYLVENFGETGFYQYLLLLLTGGLDILVAPGELLLSIVESVPVLSVTLTCALLFVMLWSLSRLSRSWPILTGWRPQFNNF